LDHLLEDLHNDFVEVALGAEYLFFLNDLIEGLHLLFKSDLSLLNTLDEFMICKESETGSVATDHLIIVEFKSEIGALIFGHISIVCRFLDALLVSLVQELHQILVQLVVQWQVQELSWCSRQTIEELKELCRSGSPPLLDLIVFHLLVSGNLSVQGVVNDHFACEFGKELLQLLNLLV
jgi:hypothetical protein